MLITGADGRRILADGGMRSSYRTHVAPALNRLHRQGARIDLAYVSHIDQDHIAGILQLMDDLVDWKVHEFQIANGNPNHPQPDSPRPPEVRNIWHNAFHEQIGDNAGAIEDMLAANASLLSTLKPKWAQRQAEECGDLATSMAEAVKLSRRIGSEQLDIPLNPEYGGGLMFVTEPTESLRIGGLSITVIGPWDEDLKKLRDKWNTWLRSERGRRSIRRIREEAREDADRLNWSEFDRIMEPILIQAGELGDRGKVTLPNLASLMLCVEENGRTVLMTGDGHCQDILDGLEACGKLDAAGNIHVDVLKVQHHGSEHNTNREFCRRVTADHYIFCGNGAHENPDLNVVRTYLDSRIGPASRRSRNAQVGNRFRMWFNSSSGSTKTRYRNHMRRLERMVQREVRPNGPLQCSFLDDRSFFNLNL
jgi:hypothetical protein